MTERLADQEFMDVVRDTLVGAHSKEELFWLWKELGSAIAKNRSGMAADFAYQPMFHEDGEIVGPHGGSHVYLICESGEWGQPVVEAQPGMDPFHDSADMAQNIAFVLNVTSAAVEE